MFTFFSSDLLFVYKLFFFSKVEVNGVSIQTKSLNEVVPLLQNTPDQSIQDQGIKLKLARLISIPERPELYALTARRNSNGDSR